MAGRDAGIGGTGLTSCIDFNHMRTLATENAEAYRDAGPFPHVVFSNAFDAGNLAKAAAEFPHPESLEDWRQNDATDGHGRIAQAGKLGYSKTEALGDTLRRLITDLQSAPFLQVLEDLTGIPDLSSDAEMLGGGLHQYYRGAELRIHADFNKHPTTGLNRRLNLLLFLNSNWQDDWGGALELWDRDMRRCVQSIKPEQNTLVIFSTSRHSYHGLPEPLTCPPDVTRKSIALYYYSSAPAPDAYEVEHSTIWRTRPGER